MITCPNCNKESVYRATPDEIRPLLKHINEKWCITVRNESEMYLLVCGECGRFYSIHRTQNKALVQDSQEFVEAHQEEIGRQEG